MKNKNKKSSFYKNKNRNQKWTEEPVGRPIAFADKYVEGSDLHDKFDNMRSKEKTKLLNKQKRLKWLKNIGIVLLCVVIVCVGYTAMDVRMIRHAEPAEQMENINSNKTADMTNVKISASSVKIDEVSLDNAAMLSSIIKDTTTQNFDSITFDAKREDGSIGYDSALASVDSFNAVSSAATALKDSVKALEQNDIMPIARICCYKDNIAPLQQEDMALKNGNKLYKDDDGNYYLNPNSTTAYEYIKDIIQECYGYGITVFALYGCDLPDGVSDSYKDGFATIAKKLDKDFDGKIKLLQEIDTDISGQDAETGEITNEQIKTDIDELDALKSNQIYYIKINADDDEIINQIQKSSIDRYIVEE